MGETMPAGVITIADARELLWIEDELHERLIKAIGHDFYPPERPAKPTLAELRAKLKPLRKSAPLLKSKPISKIVGFEKKKEGKFGFKITIKSSVGSVVARENVRVDSKGEADAKAQQTIEKLGLKKATYKIS